MSSKKQLLDPIGTVCRLISLHFEPKDTRISIYNHAISIQPPLYIQGLYRMFYGDNRDNISELYHVITRFIEWYIVPLQLYMKDNDKKPNLNSNKYYKPRKETSESESDGSQESDKCMKVENDSENAEKFWECIKKLCTYLYDALSKLQETYELGNVVLALQCYINLLKDAINGTYSIERLPKYMVTNESKNFLDYKKIKVLWDFKKVNELCELYDKCFEIDKEILSMPNTSGQEQVIANKKNKIKGYLLALDKLLNISDESFRSLLQSSTQGC